MFISSLGIAFLPDSQSAELHFNEKKKDVRFTLWMYNKVAQLFLCLSLYLSMSMLQ